MANGQATSNRSGITYEVQVRLNKVTATNYVRRRPASWATGPQTDAVRFCAGGRHDCDTEHSGCFGVRG